MLAELREFAEPRADARPMYPGAVVLAGRNQEVVVHEALGYALRYADADGAELPRDEWVPMRTDTIFDVASVSKLFTSLVVMRQVELGRVELDQLVASYLPAFATNGKHDVTIRQLLTHTSGLPAWMPLWRDWPDRDARVRAAQEVAPAGPPDTTYVYSDLNLIILASVVEQVTGEPLETLVRKGITEPLGMVDTGYNPPESKLDRVAATEYQAAPNRGMIRGSVHDENAWSLEGVAGHAGIFSTASDLGKLCMAILDDGGGILRPETLRLMMADYNEAFPTHAHGLGFELNQRWFMGALSGARTIGHTGFTGTSVVIDTVSGAFVVLLTNRVHPTRSWSVTNNVRRAVARRVAAAFDVGAGRERSIWFAAANDHATATLTLPICPRTNEIRLGFDLFVDAERTDGLTVELSRDQSTWEPVPFTCSSRGRVSAYDPVIAELAGRHWQQAYALVEAEPGPAWLRWRYVPDPAQPGRGVYIDDLRLADGRGQLLDVEQQSDQFVADGWSALSA